MKTPAFITRIVDAMIESRHREARRALERHLARPHRF